MKLTCFHIFLTTSRRRRGKTELTFFPWVILLSKQLLISLDNGSLVTNPFSFSAGNKMKVYLNGGDFSHPIIETRKLATCQIHQDTRQETSVALSHDHFLWLLVKFLATGRHSSKLTMSRSSKAMVASFNDEAFQLFHFATAPRRYAISVKTFISEFLFRLIKFLPR